MRSFFAALRTLVLPYGQTSGRRIILDGVNGRIDVYNALDQLITRIDSTGYHLYDAGGTEIGILDNVGLFLDTVAGVIRLESAVGVLVANDDGSTAQMDNVTGRGGSLILNPRTTAGVTLSPAYLNTDVTTAPAYRPSLRITSPRVDGKSPALVDISSADNDGKTSLFEVLAGRVNLLADVIITGTIKDGNAIPIPKFQQGSQPMSVTAPATTATVAVAFAIPFVNTPRMAAPNIKGNSGLYARWGARAINVTNTGFDLFIFAVNPTTNANNFSVDVDWVATATA